MKTLNVGLNFLGVVLSYLNNKECSYKAFADDFFEYSAMSSISLLGYEAVNYAKLGFENSDIEKNWKKEKELLLTKNIYMDMERANLLSFMDKNKIWYLPLKGVILKELYPVPELREMADNDILIDSSKMQIVWDYMVSRGYEANVDGHHNTFIKAPFYNFEIHSSLFSSYHNKTWKNYFDRIKDRLIKDDNNSYGYHMTDEDFYIYITVHEYKHFNGGGNGIRALIDRFLYLKEKNNTLNWSYVEEQLNILGVMEYEKKCRSFCLDVMGSDDFITAFNSMSHDMKNFISGFILSSTYGSYENVISNRKEKLKAKNAFEYCLKRIIPPDEIMETYYPFFYKHKLLLPIGYVYRIVTRLFKRNTEIFKEAKEAFKQNKE